MELNIEIKKLNDRSITPKFADRGSNGADLYSSEEGTVIIPAFGRKLIKTGISISLPENYLGFVTPRSGLAYKHGITVLNAPGLIDTSYRGEIGVILHNTTSEPYEVCPKDRIAQLVIVRNDYVQFIESEELEETERGANGFGSSGK